ncbi:MAG: hypothetical protein BWY17_05192 [Deltaproteobacteria bacterium ADurb.Bin207]|nr:MAG: hypothetical protein BWY17_05192 [Deltaproteobacteria bacterium ADurb.Bin207]
MSYDCQQCANSSPCATEYYDYQYATDAQDYSNCRSQCQGVSSCQATCCTKYPTACKERKELIDCICN